MKKENRVRIGEPVEVVPGDRISRLDQDHFNERLS